MIRITRSKILISFFCNKSEKFTPGDPDHSQLFEIFTKKITPVDPDHSLLFEIFTQKITPGDPDHSQLFEIFIKIYSGRSRSFKTF